MVSMLCIVCSWFGIGIKSLWCEGMWKYLFVLCLIFERLVCSLWIMLFSVCWLDICWYRFFIYVLRVLGVLLWVMFFIWCVSWLICLFCLGWLKVVLFSVVFM